MTPESIAADMEAEADRLEAFIKAQNSFYLQYEDQGQTSTRIWQLRNQAKKIREGTAAP